MFSNVEVHSKKVTPIVTPPFYVRPYYSTSVPTPTILCTVTS